MNTSIKIVLDRKPLSNGQHSVYLRIIKERRPKFIYIGLKCYKENFADEQFLKGHPNHKIENKILINFKAKAERIIRDFQLDLKDFSLQEFEDKFKDKPEIQNLKVKAFYEEIIDELERSGRISYAKSFKDTKTSFLKFAGDNITFREINLVTIEKYEVYLRETKNQNGGIAFKMRHLRALLNIAIKRKVMLKDNYPFHSYKISKLKQENNKISLSIDEFKKIKNVDLTKAPELLETYYFFMFSIYARGMNFADMAKLKWTDISNNRIYYKRSKTKHSFNLEITENIQDILDYFKKHKRNSGYVFPILFKDDLTPKQIANRKHKVLSRFNRDLKQLASLANIDKNLTSYVARHSFATILKNLGSSVEVISEMMGHSDVKITMNYLKDFENDILDNEMRKLENL